MTKCAEPGCGGTLAPDNYCDTCGTLFKPSAPLGLEEPALASPTPAAPVASGSMCGRDGCNGRIAADGYCDICGLIAQASASTATGAATGSSSAPVGGSGNGASAAHPSPSSLGIPSSPSTLPSLAAPTAPSTSQRLRASDSATGPSRRTVSLSVRTASARTGIGAGLVSVPPTTVGSPEAAVMSAEEIRAQLGEVAEADRFCAQCGKPVGRATGGREGRLKGFCGSCRAPFDFVTNEPSLAAGELVAGQYEIVGALAHGGMGWVYLGRDRAVSDRWVVLKGLLNENDPDAVAAAVAERRFLAEIEHANIVNIYNFVTHRGSGYIVMEMVGGQSLNSKLKARREANGGVHNPLPATDAIAYILGVLPALGYLHDRGLVYNDLKPANVMAVADDVKLIDLGAVMRIDDHQAAIFGTPGFQAPEMATDGPSAASDLYTVGRTLAVLILRFVFHQGPYEHTLPPISEAPLLGQWESLHRFLLRATAPHPDDRFQSAAEMAEQLTGVLREMVALTEGRPRPTTSQLFEGDQLVELLVNGADDDVTIADWRMLPPARIDEAGSAAPFLMSLPEGDPERAARSLQAGIESGQIQPIAEVLLRLTWEQIKLAGTTGGGDQDIQRQLAQVESMNPWDWRVHWYRSINLLRLGDATAAAEGFSKAWTELPGETAPKLAVALAAEVAGEYERAASLYELVIGSDSSFVSAAFGLARCKRALNQHAEAVAAYGRVPVSSAAHAPAQTAAVRALIQGGSGGVPTLAELMQASSTVQKLQLDVAERAELTADLYRRTLSGLEDGTIKPQQAKMMGTPLEERALRRGLEDTYRLQARMASSPAERAEYVDRANQVRPRSLF